MAAKAERQEDGSIKQQSKQPDHRPLGKYKLQVIYVDNSGQSHNYEGSTEVTRKHPAPFYRK